MRANCFNLPLYLFGHLRPLIAETAGQGVNLSVAANLFIKGFFYLIIFLPLVKGRLDGVVIFNQPPLTPLYLRRGNRILFIC